MTKFSGTLPAGDANGLTALSNALLRNPKGTHLIIGVIDVKTITTDVDTADQVATVRFRRVEPVDPDDRDTAVRLLARGAERRTGATMLPIEVEDELQALMENLDFNYDPVTGEVTDIKGEPGHKDDEEETAGGDPAGPPATSPADNPDVPGPDPDTEPPKDPGNPEKEKPATPGPDKEPPGPDDRPNPAQPPAKPKRGRGRPKKETAAPAAPETVPADLAAADLPMAPWDNEPAEIEGDE